MHFHYVLSMGAVFALFSAWYFWIPKILGLDYNIMLGKAHFWVMFIGVKLKGRNFDKQQSDCKGIKHIHELSGGSPRTPRDNFVLFFENVIREKKSIYSQLRGKSGVYLFINNNTQDLYVGSSLRLSKRMTSHFYHANSGKVTQIVITRAMRKYKLENFSLAILEFCPDDIVICSKLEQKWMDYYNPKYNVLNIAYSSSGFHHKIETINKLKELFKKENHPKFGLITSVETKKAISEGVKKFYLKNSHVSKGLKGKFSPQYGLGGSFVFCYNEKGDELIFPSINATRQHFKVRWTFIKHSIDTNNYVTMLNDKWIIQSIPRQN